MADRETLLRGALVNGLGILAKLSRVAYLAIFSRLLSAETFALFLLLYALAEILSTVAGLGTEHGLLQKATTLWTQDRRQQVRSLARRATLMAMALGGLFGLALIALSPLIASLTGQSEELVMGLRWVGLALPGAVGLRSAVAATRCTLNMKYDALIKSVIEPLIMLALGSVFLWHRSTLSAVMLAHVLSQYLSFLVVFFWLHQIFPPGPADDTPLKKLASAGWAIGSMDIVNTLRSKVDLYIVAAFLPLATVGIYGLLVELANLFRKLKLAFDLIVMPMAQAHFKGNTLIDFKPTLQASYDWVVFLSVLIFGVFAVAPQPLFAIFDIDHSQAQITLIIMALGQLAFVTLGLLESIMAYAGASRSAFFQSLALLGLNTAFLFWLTPRFGMLGAAMGTALSMILLNLWRLRGFVLRFGFHPFLPKHLSYVVLAVLSGALALALDLSNFAFSQATSDGIRLLVFSMGYVALTWMFLWRGSVQPPNLSEKMTS